jgi:hypothetical protein
LELSRRRTTTNYKHQPPRVWCVVLVIIDDVESLVYLSLAQVYRMKGKRRTKRDGRGTNNSQRENPA